MEELYDAFAPVCRTLARVDLAAIRHNGQIAKKLHPEQKLLSVLKADCYGHGIAGVMPAYDTFSDYYAVATVEEGHAARAGTKKPVLLYSEPDGTLMLFSDGTVHCGNLVRENAHIYNGKGGGNKTMARAIFSKKEYVDTFIDLVEKHLR